MKRYLLLSALLFISACGGSKPVPKLYGLRASPSNIAACRKPASIKIYEPVAGAGLDSARISVLDTGQKQTFYRNVRWNAAASRMVQLYLADTLERSAMFSSVLTDDSSSSTDWILESQLRDFSVDKTSGSPHVVIRLSASLVRAEDRTPLFSLPLEVRRDVSGQDMAGIVRVFNSEMDQLSIQLMTKLKNTLRDC